MSQQEIVDKLCDNDKMGPNEIKQLWYHGLALVAAPSIGKENISLEDRIEICYNLGISPRLLMATCKRKDFSYVKTIKKIESEIWFKATINKIVDDISIIYAMENKIENLDEIKQILENSCILLNNIKIKLGSLDTESVLYKHVWVHIIPHIEFFTKSILHYEECIDIIDDINKDPANKRLHKLLNYSLDDYDTYNDINTIINIYNDKKIGLNDDVQIILKDLYKKAIPDFKDVPSESIMEISSIYIENMFDLFDIKMYEEEESVIMPSVEKHSDVLEINGQILPGYYMKLKKGKYIELDYHTKPGFIIYKKLEMTVPFFIEWIKTQIK